MFHDKNLLMDLAKINEHSNVTTYICSCPHRGQWPLQYSQWSPQCSQRGRLYNIHTEEPTCLLTLKGYIFYHDKPL